MHHPLVVRVMAMLALIILQRTPPVSSQGVSSAVCKGIFDFYFVLDRYDAR